MLLSKGFVDSHMHVVTERYRQAIVDAGGDPSGFPAPEWTPEDSFQLMEKIQIQHAILSVTTPGPCIAGAGEKGRKLARDLNNEVADIVDASAGRFSFFASLPDWIDVEGTLQELDYIFEKQKKAVGIVVMSSYSDRLLGDKTFKPIWERLNKYKAIVFIHPTFVTIEPKFIAGWLPQPIVDFPQNTTRTATDLIVSGRFQECPEVDIILSHAGGTLPYISARFLEILRVFPQPEDSKVTYESALKAFNRFYYDTALSSSPTQLDSIVHLNATDRLLFGSDFPYANEPVATAFTRQLSNYISASSNGHILNEVNLTKNAVRLFDEHGIVILKQSKAAL